MLVIRRVLFERGISQRALAGKTGVDPASLSRIVNGKEPAYSKRGKRIAEALGWTGDPAGLFQEESGKVHE